MKQIKLIKNNKIQWVNNKVNKINAKKIWIKNGLKKVFFLKEVEDFK